MRARVEATRSPLEKILVAKPESKRTKTEKAALAQIRNERIATQKSALHAKRSKAAKKGARTRAKNRVMREVAAQGVVVPANYYSVVASFIEHGIPIPAAERLTIRLSRINQMKNKAKRYDAFYQFAEDLSEDYDYEWDYERDGFY